MNSYTVFARYYDTLMQDAEYKKRALYLNRILDQWNRGPGLTVDLACGTGSIALELAGLGYDMICVDQSTQMLEEARKKFENAEKSALFIHQDMRALDLYGTVDAVVCCLDSINHLPSPRSVEETFKRVSLFLNPGGLFIFDVNTPYKFENILAGNTFVYDYDEVYCVWQNSYRRSTGACRFDLTFFERTEAAYQRYDECFYEKSYSERTLVRCLKAAGLDLMNRFEEFTFEDPGEKAERIVYVARKPLFLE